MTELELIICYGNIVQTVGCESPNLNHLFEYFDEQFAGGATSPWQLYTFGPSPELRRVRHSSELRNGMRLLLVVDSAGHGDRHPGPHLLSNKVFDRGDPSICGLCGGLINPSPHVPLIALHCLCMFHPETAHSHVLRCITCQQMLHRACVAHPKCVCPAATRASVYHVPHRFAQGQFPASYTCPVCGLRPREALVKCQECDYYCHVACQSWAPSCTSDASIGSQSEEITTGGGTPYGVNSSSSLGVGVSSERLVSPPQRPAAAPPQDNALEDLPILRGGRFKYAIVVPGKSYMQDLCTVELTVKTLRLVFTAPDGRYSTIELPVATLQKQWPSDGAYIALASPLFPANTVVHIAAHPVDLNENAFMNYVLSQAMSYAQIISRFAFAEDDTHFLNRGSFGSVYQGLDIETKQRVAIKVINMTAMKEREQKHVGTELTLLQDQSHPGLMYIRQACILTIPGVGAKAYIVMDFAAGGDLLDRVMKQPKKHLSEREARFYTYQILQAVAYLHHNKIAHRDLKLDNVLLMESRPFTRARVADFGYSRVVGEDLFMQTMVGTPEYMAPEVVNETLRQGGKLGYGLAADVWSIGVCTFICLTGRFPFANSVPISERRLDPVTFLSAFDATLEAKKFVLQCMNRDETARYTAQQALQDPWFMQEPSTRDDILQALKPEYLTADVNDLSERIERL